MRQYQYYCASQAGLTFPRSDGILAMGTSLPCSGFSNRFRRVNYTALNIDCPETNYTLPLNHHLNGKIKIPIQETHILF